ncbi:MAG: hypothetical protein FH748_05750 [Balneolaceae bacterium]|nr:hypothetical protein [Balneolaceae bacterium]
MSFVLKFFISALLLILYLPETLFAQPQHEWITVYFNMPADTTVAISGNTSNHSYDLFKSLTDRIDNANSSVDLCIYDLEHPRLARALIRAKKRGVRIRIVTDSHNRTDAGPIDEAMWTMLSKAGILSIDDDGDVYRADGTIADYDLVNDGADMHNKFAVIDALSPAPDDDYVWTGSTNLTYTGAYNTNHTIVIKDTEVTRAYRQEFNQMWGSATEEPNPLQARFHKDKKDVSQHIFDVGGTKVELYFAPVNRERSKPSISKRLVEVVGEEAQHDINFQAFAITPDIPLSQKMWNRSATGNIKLNGVIDYTFYSRYKKAEQIWGSEEARSGSRMILPSNELRKLHHKTIVLDAAHPDSNDVGVVISGSYNFSRNAEFNNDENLLIIYSDTIANQFYQDFMGTMSRAKKETYPPAPPINTGKWYDIYSIRDGSHFSIELLPGFGYGIRLLGLEVPSVYAGADSADFYSVAAAEYVRNVLEGRKVRISGINDEMPGSYYNSFYGYIHFDDNGTVRSLNKLLLEQGYARYSGFGRQQPDSIRTFKAYESNAKLKKAGFWKFPPKIGLRVLRTKELEGGGAVNLVFPININTADAATLQLLPGIGPAYAKRIIEYRTENGSFKTVQEITNVKGIGPKTLQKLRPIIIL